MNAQEQFATMQRLKAEMEKNDANKAKNITRNDGMSQS